MSDERLRVHEHARDELLDLQEDGETYSDVLRRVLPDDPSEDAIVTASGDMVVISVDAEVHELATALAGDGVTVGRVVDYYLFKRRVEDALPPNKLLEEVYTRRT